MFENLFENCKMLVPRLSCSFFFSLRLNLIDIATCRVSCRKEATLRSLLPVLSTWRARIDERLNCIWFCWSLHVIILKPGSDLLVWKVTVDLQNWNWMDLFMWSLISSIWFYCIRFCWSLHVIILKPDSDLLFWKIAVDLQNWNWMNLVMWSLVSSSLFSYIFYMLYLLG